MRCHFPELRVYCDQRGTSLGGSVECIKSEHFAVYRNVAIVLLAIYKGWITSIVEDSKLSGDTDSEVSPAKSTAKGNGRAQ